jgi:hypothetical protein
VESVRWYECQNPWSGVRLFALLNISLSDTTMAFLEAKSTYQRWRPVTAVELAGGCAPQFHHAKAVLTATKSIAGGNKNAFDKFR